MAVNGYAVGFGMTMLAFVNLVFMSTEARLALSLPSWERHRGRLELPFRQRRPRAAWILLSSESIDSAEARGHRVGMEAASRSELLEVTNEYARGSQPVRSRPA